MDGSTAETRHHVPVSIRIHLPGLYPDHTWVKRKSRYNFTIESQEQVQRVQKLSGKKTPADCRDNLARVQMKRRRR